jgi:hypothetical protein
MRLALGATVVMACVGLAGCTSSDGVEGAITPRELPANLCESVPDTLVTAWSLEEESADVDNGDSLATASCRMTGPDASLDVSLTSYAGGSTESAERFAGEDQVDQCGNVRSLGGDYTDDDTSCGSVVDDGDTTTVARVEQVTGSYGVTRVEMTGPASRADEVDDEVGTLLEAMAAVLGED